MATLDFKGKALVQNYHLSVKYHELVPKRDRSLTDKVRLDDNLIIHGDNLKALKALLPTYAGQVKCIYIDPPYNTGNEGWAYNDNVNSPMMQEWLGKAVDREDLTRHDKWLPDKIKMRKGTRKLTREDNSPLQMSLFEQVAEDGLNSEEQSVAWYFEKQAQLLWWYRNLSRQDYRLQGWRKNGIYPDFIVSRTSTADKTDFDKVFVVESKGIHLKNDDTDYKKQVFKLCNKLAEEKSWTELGLEFPERKMVFELVYGDEWQKVLNVVLK